jgi:hypothetical protein
VDSSQTQARAISDVRNILGESKRIAIQQLSKQEIKKLRHALALLHTSENLSILEISKKLGRSYSFTWAFYSRLGIRTRTIAEANRESAPKRTLTARSPFSGTDHDQAYMMGFAEGDLDERRVSSLAIMVSSTTTHPAFARLFKSLFSNYGPVYQYPIFQEGRGYKWKVAARLDNSFSFLLRETRQIYPAVRDKAGIFFSWLAGIVDSDGSINITNSNGYLRVSLIIYNQDLILLTHIRRELLAAGFHPVGPYLSAKKGYVVAQYRIKYMKDMMNLILERKYEVLEILERLPLRLREKQERSSLATKLDPIIKWSIAEAQVRELEGRIKKEVSEFVMAAERSYKSRGLGKATSLPCPA